MDKTEIEKNVFETFSTALNNAETKDTINKVYRQARIWVRWHCHFAKACTEEESRELNNRLKHMRWDRLEELGYHTPESMKGE